VLRLIIEVLAFAAPIVAVSVKAWFDAVHPRKFVLEIKLKDGPVVLGSEMQAKDIAKVLSDHFKPDGQ
jgi:hypothetical protein